MVKNAGAVLRVKVMEDPQGPLRVCVALKSQEDDESSVSSEGAFDEDADGGFEMEAVVDREWQEAVLEVVDEWVDTEVGNVNFSFLSSINGDKIGCMNLEGSKSEHALERGISAVLEQQLEVLLV